MATTPQKVNSKTMDLSLQPHHVLREGLGTCDPKRLRRTPHGPYSVSSIRLLQLTNLVAESVAVLRGTRPEASRDRVVDWSAPDSG